MDFSKLSVTLMSSGLFGIVLTDKLMTEGILQTEGVDF